MANNQPTSQTPESTIEELKAQLSSETQRADQEAQKVAEAQTAIEELSSGLLTSASLCDELTKKLKSETERADQEKKRADEAEELVLEISGKITKVESAGVKVYPTLKVGKEKFTFVSEPGILPEHGLVNVDDLSDNCEILVQLVQREASCLKKV